MDQVTVLPLGFSNALLIQGPKMVLVDTGMNVSRERYCRLFNQLNVAPRDIGLIVISHGHPDHFANIQEIKELTGAPVLCHKEAVQALLLGEYPPVVARNSDGEHLKKMLKDMPRPRHRPVWPDLTMDDNFDLRTFGIDGQVIHTPGHTDCSLSVVLKSGEALVGDIFFKSPFTGKCTLAVFANNDTALFTSAVRLAKSASLFFGAHGGPYRRKEIIASLLSEMENYILVSKGEIADDYVSICDEIRSLRL